jgi:hypothetical protein
MKSARSVSTLLISKVTKWDPIERAIDDMFFCFLYILVLVEKLGILLAY